jgi:hypothetical protein
MNTGPKPQWGGPYSTLIVFLGPPRWGSLAFRNFDSQAGGLVWHSTGPLGLPAVLHGYGFLLCPIHADIGRSGTVATSHPPEGTTIGDDRCQPSSRRAIARH